MKQKSKKQPPVMIEVQDLTVNYKLVNDRVKSMKEFLIASLLHKITYESFMALEKVSFQVRRGEVLGIVGHNGAGKSTLLKTVSGILKPSKGQVLNYGRVVPMLELGSGFDLDLTGQENIFLNGAILGYQEKFLNEKYEQIVEFSELGRFIQSPIRNYSSGMMMRLAFSVATVVNPEILIVDEILAVGDSDFQEKSKRRMLELMGGGTTVLFVSHSMDQIRELCNRVLWIEHGQVQMIGTTKEVCDCYEKS